ncbi:MAG: hypothetical protein Q8P59_08920 [Dehalococcoidia bacterium]|nr:hypothetical protein [Dehalococcoidia bacterium]
MAVDLPAISRLLDIPPEELMKKSILSFISHEVRQAEWEIKDIEERYGVSSLAELEDRIKTQAVYSHPAWEDLIRWENIVEYVHRLRAIEEELKLAA